MGAPLDVDEDAVDVDVEGGVAEVEGLGILKKKLIGRSIRQNSQVQLAFDLYAFIKLCSIR